MERNTIFFLGKSEQFM